ncbi:hypothetical protein CkaCkLH20_01579 [Colletotrichum karsti]|uniref:Uncharacterized protein n=1 Tax=Colletotrichum karsti TaxID=1095194 RepID=A0A9P6IDU7_9PEZI|nr:uncharacterized protein CkaCkLH20_01579 [Colletotrichum karsti]KAF9880537.1 hypothetical protein CkaCkLH20_01579 [Colletotrichum karsti]
MISQGSLLALSVLSFTTLVSARPENLRGRTYPDTNTCPCVPAPEPITVTSTTTATATRTETVEATAPAIRETTTESQILTLTIVRPPVTETVHISKDHPGETVTVTCTETVSEKPDGSVTTKTQPPSDGEHTSTRGPESNSEVTTKTIPPSDDEHTKTYGTDSDSETKPPHHETTKTPDSTSTESSPAVTSNESTPTAPSGPSSDNTATTTPRSSATTVQSVKPTAPSAKTSEKPTQSSVGDDSSSPPEPTTSKHHCDHWDGNHCVKPTTASESFVTATTTRGARPTGSICPVSVAFITVYNTVTATVYQSGAGTASSTAQANVPRAPTAVGAY